MDMERYKGRKFALTIFSIVLCSLFLGIGKIGSGEWTGFMLGVLGMYKVADVTEKKGDK